MIKLHETKRPKEKRRLYFEYFRTCTGKLPPNKDFQLRVSVPEDPLVRIYERISYNDRGVI